MYAPTKVEALADKVIVDVACGGGCHSLAVTSTGSMYTCGNDWSGSSYTLVPTLILPDLSSKGIISVSAGLYFKACVTKAGEVFTWGEGSTGKLGHGDESNQKTPKRVEGLIGVKAKQVSCGGHNTAVCTEDGRVYTFGEGTYGQLLVHGEKTNKTSPTLFKALEGKHITQCSVDTPCH